MLFTPRGLEGEAGAASLDAASLELGRTLPEGAAGDAAEAAGRAAQVLDVQLGVDPRRVGAGVAQACTELAEVMSWVVARFWLRSEMRDAA